MVASIVDVSNGSTRNLEAMEVLYTDGSVERADLKQIKKTIPGARQEFHLFKVAKAAQIGTTMVGMFGLGVTVVSILDKNVPLAIGCGIGTIGGFWGLVHFGIKKRQHRDDFVDVCNKYFAKQIEKSKKVGFNLETISPNDIKLGVVNNNGVGMSFVWNISK